MICLAVREAPRSEGEGARPLRTEGKPERSDHADERGRAAVGALAESVWEGASTTRSGEAGGQARSTVGVTGAQ